MYDNVNRENIIIWWTPFIGNIEYARTCGSHARCLFTENRHLLDHANFKGHVSEMGPLGHTVPQALLFYGSNFNKADLPIPRSYNHLWALFHEESPKNSALLMYDAALSFFNVTATFSQNSDFPLTLQHLDSYEMLVSRNYTHTVDEKNQFQQDELLAPVLYMQSICDTMSGRDPYIMELMQYINVDSYGRCLNNKELPESLSGKNYLSTMDSEELYKFISRYKFVISYENSVCNDYVTEKLWRTIVVGSVPVYFGAPNIKQWLPNNKTAILIDDFKSPKELAEFLLDLNEDENEYNTYLRHKNVDEDPVTNKMLLNALATRGYRTESLLQDFECFVCAHSLRKTLRKGYECEEKLVFPPTEDKRITEMGWQLYVQQGKCEAETLAFFLNENRPFSERDFNKALLKRYELGLCEQ
ncbi:Alpha-(1,3)-fucosyltransferase 10 [Pseudolycoriella hygida]|uniref:Fucosyltransferase n=1 Tax=Pseudolycoriella hygida TaxID=35572 RepID=A0A9Q0S637_9DIPT|nr:Alpha-(1,3)-fucosyltransferase 10 [Pseudolycoriella hygida]